MTPFVSATGTLSSKEAILWPSNGVGGEDAHLVGLWTCHESLSPQDMVASLKP
eukprot:c23699_g1_i1 orf=456-614(+)